MFLVVHTTYIDRQLFTLKKNRGRLRYPHETCVHWIILIPIETWIKHSLNVNFKEVFACTIYTIPIKKKMAKQLLSAWKEKIYLQKKWTNLVIKQEKIKCLIRLNGWEIFPLYVVKLGEQSKIDTNKKVLLFIIHIKYLIVKHKYNNGIQMEKKNLLNCVASELPRHPPASGTSKMNKARSTHTEPNTWTLVP